MADGTKKSIEDVKVGDKVVATDPQTGEQVGKTVDHVFVHEDTLIDLAVDGGVITTTRNHPFWSVTDQRFERADELSTGEQVLGADGRVITVSGLRQRTGHRAAAYNLSVEGIHTYHVGAAEVLVHNACPISGAANTGSALSRASQAAFRAAADPASIFVKNTHLASAAGNGAKFATDDISQVQGWISRGLQSDGMRLLPNQLDDTFRAIVPGGGVIGTRGQEFIRVIVTGDGRVINAFPVNVR